MKRILLFVNILMGAVSLFGCGDKHEEKEKLGVPDITIEQKDETYHKADGNDWIYPSSDAMLVLAYNEYQCVDTNVDYNEETKTYICTIEFKNIID